MPCIKKISLALLVLIFTSSSPISVSRAQEFKGAYEMFVQDDLQDFFILSAILQRCSGVYGAMGKYLPKADAQTAKLKETSVLLSMAYFEKSVELLNRKGQNSPTENLNQVDKSIRFFVDFYYQQLEVSQQRTGSIFSDWVQREFNLCNRLREQVLG